LESLPVNDDSEHFHLLEQWLANWEQWLNECLSSGIDHIGTGTKLLISNWQKDANTLGFSSYVELTEQLLEANNQTSKVKAFNRCLLGYQALQQLLNIHYVSHNR